MLAAERAELVELLRGLSPAEWETPSLCTGWRVRDVVAHLLTVSTPLPVVVSTALRARSIDGTNEAIAARYAALSTTELTERFARGAWIERFGRRLALSDMFVHQQDIRRPLDRPRPVPPERLRAVLAFPDPFARPWRITRGLRFSAVDLDWSSGAGPLVSGPGEALALAMVGRTAAFGDLTGPGVAVLRDRVR